MKIGDRVFIKGIVDEIRKDIVIIKNDGGYFGTIPSEIIDKETTVSVLPDENGYYPNVCGMCVNAETDLCEWCGGNKNFKKEQTKIPDFYKKYAEQEPCEDACEKCLYAEETDGSHCYECVKGESKFKAQESEE